MKIDIITKILNNNSSGKTKKAKILFLEMCQ